MLLKPKVKYKNVWFIRSNGSCNTCSLIRQNDWGEFECEKVKSSKGIFMINICQNLHDKLDPKRRFTLKYIPKDYMNNDKEKI